MTKTLKHRINVNTATDQSGNNSLAEYHSIPRLNWGSFRCRREEKWGLFKGWESFRGSCTDNRIEKYRRLEK